MYKEDFAKFADSLKEVVEYIHEKQPESDVDSVENETTDIDNDEDSEPVKDYTNVEFEDI